MQTKHVVIVSSVVGALVLAVIALSILLSVKLSSSTGAPTPLEDVPDPKQPNQIEQSHDVFAPREGESANEREQRETDHRLALMRPTPSKRNQIHPPSTSTMGRLLNNHRQVYGTNSRDKKRGVESTATFDRLTQLDPNSYSYRMVDPQ